MKKDIRTPNVACKLVRLEKKNFLKPSFELWRHHSDVTAKFWKKYFIFPMTFYGRLKFCKRVCFKNQVIKSLKSNWLRNKNVLWRHLRCIWTKNAQISESYFGHTQNWETFFWLTNLKFVNKFVSEVQLIWNKKYFLNGFITKRNKINGDIFAPSLRPPCKVRLSCTNNTLKRWFILLRRV